MCLLSFAHRELVFFFAFFFVVFLLAPEDHTWAWLGRAEEESHRWERMSDPIFGTVENSVKNGSERKIARVCHYLTLHFVAVACLPSFVDCVIEKCTAGSRECTAVRLLYNVAEGSWGETSSRFCRRRSPFWPTQRQSVDPERRTFSLLNSHWRHWQWQPFD